MFIMLCPPDGFGGESITGILNDLQNNRIDRIRGGETISLRLYEICPWTDNKIKVKDRVANSPSSAFLATRENRYERITTSYMESV